MIYDVNLISEWFLSYDSFIRANDHGGVTPQKLQQILYYAQSASLAMRGEGEPLFDEPIIKKTFGPCVEKMYEWYSHYAGPFLYYSTDFDLESIETRDVKLLTYVYDRFGRYEPWYLRNKIWNELPYIKTKEGEEISRQGMKMYHVNHYGVIEL